MEPTAEAGGVFILTTGVNTLVILRKEGEPSNEYKHEGPPLVTISQTNMPINAVRWA